MCAGFADFRGTDEEIREAWMASDRFSEVKGYDGDRLAPERPATHLKARGRVR
ncbi:pirin [Streptomyces sp. NPDC001930]|uniref:pirin n=1 Tax=Streptomyces sp. NPDC001930 TaxID=3364625 RepID=UPI00368DF6EB